MLAGSNLLRFSLCRCNLARIFYLVAVCGAGAVLARVVIRGGIYARMHVGSLVHCLSRGGAARNPFGWSSCRGGGSAFGYRWSSGRNWLVYFCCNSYRRTGQGLLGYFLVANKQTCR